MEGVILEAGIARGYTSSRDPGASNPVDYDFREYTRLVIQTPNGKRRRIRFEQKPGFYLYYYPGTYVCRLPVFPYPLRDPQRSGEPPRGESRLGEKANDDLSGGYLCIACGSLNNRSLSEPCGRCGHSLVDPKEFWKHDSPVRGE
jgi:hypothetical protein